MSNIQRKIKEVELEIQDLELKKELITRRIKNKKPLENPILNDFLKVIYKELFISEAKLRKLRFKE